MDINRYHCPSFVYQMGDWLPPLILACFSPPIELGVISHMIYKRKDYRGAQLKYVMQLHDAHLATRMPKHS